MTGLVNPIYLVNKMESISNYKKLTDNEFFEVDGLLMETFLLTEKYCPNLYKFLQVFEEETPLQCSIEMYTFPVAILQIKVPLEIQNKLMKAV